MALNGICIFYDHIDINIKSLQWKICTFIEMNKQVQMNPNVSKILHMGWNKHKICINRLRNGLELLLGLY